MSGLLTFKRNAWLSTATIMVMSLVLFVLGGLVLVGALADTALRSVEAKIDITVYFTADTPEGQIMAVKTDLEQLPDVRGVAYISRDEALAGFRDRHREDALIAGALDELGDNPLHASLNVRAADPAHYAAISDFLAKKSYQGVEKINYFENQAVIDRLSAIMAAVRGTGAVAALFLAFVASLVAFNTIRLAIYTMREEIGIMRLVGATAWFIRGPFLISGLLYGLVASLAVTAVFFPLTWAIAPKLAVLVPDFHLFNYFRANIMQFFGIMVFSGAVLGAGSSFLAVRRYLTI